MYSVICVQTSFIVLHIYLSNRARLVSYTDFVVLRQFKQSQVEFKSEVTVSHRFNE